MKLSRMALLAVLAAAASPALADAPPPPPAFAQCAACHTVQPGRNAFNAAFCVGTNVVFRRAAVDDIGGIYTDSKSEDVWTSMILHGRGWRSVFLPETLAIGDAPDTIEGYSKQQLRWATGGFEILFTSNPLLTRRKLSLDQRLMYFVTATHYLTGIAPGLLLFVPALEIFLTVAARSGACRFIIPKVGLVDGMVRHMCFYGGADQARQPPAPSFRDIP